MLAAANNDLRLLQGMLKIAEDVSDEMFGYHVQQAVEKSLKAWLLQLGKTHPYTHDLQLLIDMIAERNDDVRMYEKLVDFTVYGTFARYSTGDFPLSLEREECVESVMNLFSDVRGRLT